MKSPLNCLIVLATAFRLIAAAPGNSTSLAVKKSLFPPVIQVVVQNHSGNELRLWKSSNSWGSRTMSFEVKDVSTGKVFLVERKKLNFTRNVAEWFAVKSGNKHTIRCDLGDDTWTTDPALLIKGKTVQIRSILNIPSTPEAREEGVFIGTLESPFQ